MHVRRRAFAGALVLTAGLLAGQVAASAAPPVPKGAPAPAPASSAAGCHQRSSVHQPSESEWLSCIGVSASLDRAPAVGETATLRIEVRADVARSTDISVELPANLSFAGAPAGARVASGRSSSGIGTATTATVHADMTANAVKNLTATVRAMAAGPAQVRVRAVAPTAAGADAGSDDVFVTVGDSSGASRLGFASSTEGTTVAAEGTAAAPARHRAEKAVSTDGLAAPHSDDAVSGASPAATSCATGTWYFLDQNGVLQPSINYQVQVWDQDSVSADDLLVSGVTDFSGGYNLCFDGADGEGGGQEVYVHFVSENSLWRVRDTAGSNSDYVNTTGVQAICDGCTADFGGLMPGNDIHRGMHAFDAVNDAWVFVPTYCWDGNDAVCRQVVVNWTASSTDGTYYSLGGNDVHLAADDPNAPHTVIHETGHAIMDDVYEDAFPSAPNCSPHYIQGFSSTGCAWTEGWAEWFPASVLDDPYFRWPSGASLNLETPTWGTSGWDSGDGVEGRIAGALIDISDFANEAYWDRYGEGDPGNLWTTFMNNVSNTLSQFWSQRAAGGFNVLSSGALADVYQNTIDYGFRDPLSSYLELTRPTPTPHNYSYNTTTDYWSVVAVRPPVGMDYDLSLYDDYSQTVNLRSSTFGGDAIDFVAVDSNHRALGDYYPRAYVYSGSGNYQVELAQGASQLSLGTQVVTMGANDVVLVRDSSLSAGVLTYFRVVPANSGQNPELFLMASNGADSATWVRSRAEAVASSTVNGAGVAEAFRYTPSVADWYGLVLTNKVGSGNYTLYVDTSAPTGSVLIDGGAATTRDTAVTLTHSASDAQTSIDAMRVSTDGVMDTEAFVPYSASQDITLPGGDGTKTVLAQYSNGAGMVSAIVSDTIVLDSRPNLVATAVSNPPANLVTGQQFAATDTVLNSGGSTAPASTTKYYLSLDTTQGSGDKKFKVGRAVPALAVDASSSGGATIKVPATTPAGTYYLLACADGPKLVVEANEADNCIASATTTVVTHASFPSDERISPA